MVEREPDRYTSSEVERAATEPSSMTYHLDSDDVDDASSSDDPDQIRENIEQTRDNMSETIDAIQEKLDPHTVAEQAKDAVRDATVGRVEDAFESASDTARETGTRMVDRIKQNPWPAALVGAGLGWAYLSNSSGSGNSGRRYAGTPYYDRTELNDYRASGTRSYGYSGAQTQYRYQPHQQSGGGLTEMIKDNPIPFALAGIGLGFLATRMMGSSDVKNIDHIGPDLSHRSRYSGGYGYSSQTSQGSVGDKASQMQEKAGETVDQAKERTGQAVDQAKARASDLADDVEQRASQFGDQAQYQLQQAQGQFQDLLRDSPLILGAVALGLGAAIGFAVPETRKEDQLMGGARDSMFEKAQDFAEEKIDEAKQVVGDTKQTMQQEAHDHGLMD